MVGAVALLAAALGSVAPASGAEGDRAWRTPVVRFEPQPGATLVVEGIGEMRGTVELRRTADGLAVINDLPMEDYLLGLAEVPSTWPAAALDAQVIAARTFALRSQLMKSTAPHRTAGADICATQSCQVFDGVDRERRDQGGAWAAAVRRTAHRYVLHNGSPIMAKYSSSNGGRSDPGGYPYLPGTDDPDDLAVSPWASWTSVVPIDQVAVAIPGPGQLVEVNRAGDVVVLRRQQPDGTIVDQGMSAYQLRRELNGGVPTPQGVPVPVPSTRFVARTENGMVVLDGGGYGHLVGMSQYGALGKARRGLGADDILAAYYGGLRSEPIDPARLPQTIRVAVALGEASATVTSPGGRFRVRAADGAAIAELTGGTWTARPDGDALQVAGPAPAPTLHGQRLAPDVLEVAVDAPARLVVHDPARRDLGVVDAGTHRIAVAGVPSVVVEADAGGGRVARIDVPLPAPPSAARVSAAAATGPSRPAVAPARLPRQAAAASHAAGQATDRTLPALVAGVLVVAVVSGGARPRLRRPRPS